MSALNSQAIFVELNFSMKRLLSFILLCLLALSGIAYSQDLKEVKAKLNGQEFSYFAMDPGKDVKGILLLFPGKGESAESVFTKTALPYTLAQEEFLTIVPNLPYTLIADEFTTKAITQILLSQIEKHETVKPNIVLGGFSAGGAVALSLAEYYLQTDSSSTIKGVFAIDPPIDLARLYSSSQNIIASNCSSLLRNQAQSTISYLNQTIGGSPKTKSDQYLKLSPFSADDPRGGNAKYLEKISIRLYTEPDLEYVRNRYCKDLRASDLNAFDLEKLNKILFLNGSSTCEYITTTGRGYHTWNIMDVENAVEWIKIICN